ncbi:hypothetical protein ALMA_1183 [Alloscardovia macacae]|uniref:Glycosyltransferase n=2 Tax=Alloscardovia macacae TaxID=1160091 RepID=A0A261F3E1_9BIFI|nr:hypothetical protein ALMA_1183 [Alloscardovia macacae]
MSRADAAAHSSTRRHKILPMTSSRNRTALFALVCAIILVTLEVAVFNIGTWLSPAANAAVTCQLSELSSRTSTQSSHSSCTSTLDGASLNDGILTIHDFGATLTLTVPKDAADRGIRTLSFTPGQPGQNTTRSGTSSSSEKTASSFFSSLTIGEKTVTLRADRPTFVFLPETVTNQIRQSGHLTLHFLSGSQSTPSLDQNTPTRIPLSSITLNARKPFHISLTRLTLLAIIAALVWALRPRSRLHATVLDPSSRVQKLAFWLLFAAPIAILSLVQVANNGFFVGTDQWHDTHNYIYSYRHYILVAESILEGHPWVNLPVDPAFDALANPYDPQLRNTILAQDPTPHIYWDFAFYNHHWYSYFGVLPALAFYLPFHAIFDQWPSIFTIILPLMAASIILLSATTIRFIHRYFPEASVAHSIIAIITLLIGLNFLPLVAATTIYVVAFSSALFVSSLGLFIWMRVSPERSKRENRIRMAAGSLLLALSVACRPTFIFMAILVLPIFLELVWGTRLLDVAREALVCILPAVLGLLPALWYNVWRFGSVFNFGAQYQITVTDMRHLHPTWLATLEGMGYYLFTPLHFNPNAPYLETPHILTSTWIHRETIIAGFFVFTPVVFVALLSVLLPSVRRALKPRFLWLYPVCGTLMGLFLCMFITRSGGLAWRYYIDFSWAFVFGSFAPLMALLVQKKKRSTWLFAGLTIYQVLVLLLTVFIGNRFDTLTQYAPSIWSSVTDALTLLP